MSVCVLHVCVLAEDSLKCHTRIWRQVANPQEAITFPGAPRGEGIYIYAYPKAYALASFTGGGG